MGAFKLDLMTILVLFVLLSVFLTMTADPKKKNSAVTNPTIDRPISQGANKVGDTGFSNADYRTSSRILPRSLPQSKFVNKTWN